MLRSAAARCCRLETPLRARTLQAHNMGSRVHASFVSPTTLCRPMLIRQLWMSPVMCQHSLLRSRGFSTIDNRMTPEVAEAVEEKKKTAVFTGTTLTVSLLGMGYASWWGCSKAMTLVAAVYAKPHIVAYIGFWSGFTTASLFSALAFSVYRLTHIRPENVFNTTFNELANSPQIQELLGEELRDAKLKTYEITDGRLSFSETMPKWLPHKVQMMYLVWGSKGTALVTTLCTKRMSLRPGMLDVDLLAVDILDKSKIAEKETLILKGDAKQLVIRDNIHQLLDIKLDVRDGKKHQAMPN